MFNVGGTFSAGGGGGGGVFSLTVIVTEVEPVAPSLSVTVARIL